MTLSFEEQEPRYTRSPSDGHPVKIWTCAPGLYGVGKPFSHLYAPRYQCFAWPLSPRRKRAGCVHRKKRGSLEKEN